MTLPIAGKPSSGAADRAHGADAKAAPLPPAGVGERLALAIRTRFEGAAEFARAAGLPEGLVRQHIHRASVPAKHLTTYVRLLRVTPEWLMDGRGVGPVNDGAPSPIRAPAPTYDPEREAIRLAIGAADVVGRQRPLTDDERADLIADLTPIIRDRLAQLRQG